MIPTAWKRARNAKAFKTHFELEGESLVRAPKGFDPEHPLIEDLRRKDFIAGVPPHPERRHRTRIS